MPQKPKLAPHLRVRIDPKLLERLEKSRENTGNTLTGEIVHRLRVSFTREDQEALALKVATAAADTAVKAMLEALRADSKHGTTDQGNQRVLLLAEVAKHEREASSQRTREALAAAKARGVKLDPRLTKLRDPATPPKQGGKS